MKPVDARRKLVAKFLQTTGPVILTEVCDRFGWTEPVVKDLLNALVREGTVAKGEFLPEKPSPQFCWQANLEALHRETLKRLKAEIEPLSLEEYADFLLHWQHVHPSTRLRGKEGFLQVIRSLEGYGTYPLLWKRDILANRVADFDPSWLEELIEDGTLVFGRFCLMGDPNYTPGAGTVLCEPASLAYLFVRNKPPNYAWLDPSRVQLNQYCLDVYDCIVESGGGTMGDVIKATGLELAKVEMALWLLYTSGVITNTSPACVFGSTLISFLPGYNEIDYDLQRKRLRKHGLKAEMGRWVPCASLHDSVTPEPFDEEEKFRRKVRQALQMFGIASVPILAHHFSGPFAQTSGSSKGLDAAYIRRACEELVGRGEAIKGFFVRGLEGDQYALPGVPEQARRTSGDNKEPMVMINSLDPACLYVSIIPVPSINAYCFPGRFMVLDCGRLVAVVGQKSGSKRRFVVNNIHLPQAMKAEGVCRLIDGVADFLRGGDLYNVLEVRCIENRAAASDPIAMIFLHRGFEVSGSGLRVSLDALRTWEPLSLPRIEMGGPSEEATDPIAAMQAVFEQVARMPVVRQRGQGRTTLKLKGRLLVNFPDGKEPIFVYNSSTQPQYLVNLLATLPDAFKPCARISKWGLELRLPLETDIEGGAFRRLVELWVEAVKRLLQKVRRSSRRGEGG